MQQDKRQHQQAPQAKSPSSAPRQVNDVQIGMLKRFQVDGTQLTVRLMGGGELSGKVRKYDTFVIDFAANDGKTHMLYKHGIVGFSTLSTFSEESAA